jgi:UDP-glucose 4-epimerase
MDAARYSSGYGLALCGATLFQRRRLGSRRPHRPVHAESDFVVKVACEAMVGKRPELVIYGTDYDTKDGTGVRDYIHVHDLATAHVQALDYLAGGGASTVLNVGYGHGFSVREVLDSVQRVGGKRLNIREAERRAGDPAVLISKADRIRTVLGWKPELDDLDRIVTTSLNWEKRILANPWQN